MTSLLEGARRLVGRGSDLGVRVEALRTAAEAGRGRLDDDLVAEAVATADRVAGRLRLSAEHTVVALAGATGSGKSSTFNALAGVDLATVGVRRPTTSWTTACVWGPDDAGDLLDWLEIPPRHRVTRTSVLDTGRPDPDLEGVVLLDLPDHDSTEVSHHLEVDRLVRVADLLVWVLDPQKYADAAVHRRYLAPLAGYAEVMVVVVNHLDTISPARREAVLADVRRLLERDGLRGVPVIGTSAREGWGIADLRAEVARRAAAKKAASTRLSADVRAAAGRLEAESGTAKPPTLAKERVAALRDAFAEAAGVPTVVSAVERSTRLRANRATGWPVTAWVSRLRPDPLKRLHLDLGPSGRQLTGTGRTSMPAVSGVQQARVDTAVRAMADEVTADLARPWAAAVRRASVSRMGDLADRLDRSLGRTDLGAERMPAWARLVRALQWLLILTALAGAGWLAALAAMGYLQLPPPATPSWRGVPVPTLLLVGGVAAGVVLALGCRLLVGLTARARARAADRRLRAAIDQVCAELVVAPVEAELAAYAAVRQALRTAAG